MTFGGLNITTIDGFQLTRLLRGVTSTFVLSIAASTISTHTPLARRDADNTGALADTTISTHTPLARRDEVLSEHQP